MDYFAWQASKQGCDKGGNRKPEPLDIVEFGEPQQDAIEVKELTASTTVVRRLRRFWMDKRS